MHPRSIYLTFGQWGVQAALDISNIRPLKVKWDPRLHIKVYPHVVDRVDGLKVRELHV
jgi:hypothetical protein